MSEQTNERRVEEAEYQQIRQITNALLRLESDPGAPPEWPTDLPYKLARKLDYLLVELDYLLVELRALTAERDRLREAARAFDETLSSYCDGPERDALRAAISHSERPE